MPRTVEVPEGVSDAVPEVKEVPVVVEQEVPRVEVDVPGFKHAPEKLLLGLDLVPGVTQERVHGGQRSYQDPGLPCAGSTFSGPSVHAVVL